MATENFYLLLELSVDPPEENPDVIEAAIKAGQAQWSRQRNHPTKGTQAQKHIGMLSEIRKVMTDPELRRKEAVKARQILKKQEKKQFARVDRQIAIFMSKGKITKKEIQKIARFHGIDRKTVNRRVKERSSLLHINHELEALVKSGRTDAGSIGKLAGNLGIATAKIQAWTDKKISDRNQDIDKYLARCQRRGYILQDEIDQLALLFSIDSAGLLKRVRCAVKKKAPAGGQPKPLEKTIENLIDDKLKIVGKTSLYDFLNLSPDADMEILRKRAKQKEAEVRKISRKDAVTTAGGALAGHCIAIFKDEETRKSYDLSRTMARIGELNADIDVAEIGGKIRSEYMEILIRTAIRLGLDIREAYDYIEGYCANQKWIVERPKIVSKKKKMLMTAAAVAVIISLAAVGVIISKNRIRETLIRKDYDAAVTRAESQSTLEGREVIYKNYLKSYPNSSYTGDISKRISDIRKEIRERDFLEAEEKAGQLAGEGKLEAAVGVYQTFLAKHAEGVRPKEAQKKIEQLHRRMEENDFEALKPLAGADHKTRIAAYNRYFTKYPEGRHRKDVRNMISRMVAGYFSDLESSLKNCETRKDWEKCIGLCDEFLKKFRNTDEGEAALGFRKRYENKIQIRSDLEDMRRRAEGKGTDYDAARAIFIDYVEGNPELPSYLKEEIAEEIKKYDRIILVHLQAEEAWEEIQAKSSDPKISLAKRIGKVESFLQRYPGNIHESEAKGILEKLNKQKAMEDKQLLARREENRWKETLAYAGNHQIGLSDRISRVQGFVRDYPDGNFSQNARKLLSDLVQMKKAEDERLRNLEAGRLRKQKEKQRILAALGRTGGRYTDNGNETVTDRRTGLVWTMFDSTYELNQCLNYQQALQFVQKRNVGGYRWRLPTVAELRAIFKNKPALPVSGGSKWFWTAENYWHGWNKMAWIVMTGGGKQAVSVEKCGAVIVVRQ